MKVSRIIGYTIIVGLTLIAVGLVASVLTSPAIAQALGMNFNCRQSFLDAGGFVLECRPVSDISPTPTDSPTATPGPTETPTPIVVTATHVPVSHDLSVCHHPMPEIGVYHDHGVCWDELPTDSPIRAWLVEHPDWRGVGQQPVSGAIENLEFPEGKHPGYNKRFWRYDTCDQIQGPTGPSCIREVYLTEHSMLTAQALRTPGGQHSANVIAVVCPKAGYPDSCVGGDRIVAARGVLHYGEPHASYKNVYCRFEGAVEYTNSNYHREQPPYWAQNVGREPGRNPVEFVSTLRNSAIASEIGHVNNLFQWAVSNRIWDYAYPYDEALCGDPANDTQAYASTNDGMEMKSVLWTLRLFLSEHPRPYEGFTDRIGDPALDCTEASFECAPLYIGADVPPGNVYFDTMVANADFRSNTLPAYKVNDVTRPDTYPPIGKPSPETQNPKLTWTAQAGTPAPTATLTPPPPATATPTLSGPTETPTATAVVTPTDIPQPGANLIVNGQFQDAAGNRSFDGWEQVAINPPGGYPSQYAYWFNPLESTKGGLHDPVPCSPSGTWYLQMDIDDGGWPAGVDTWPLPISEAYAWQDVLAPEPHSQFIIHWEEAHHMQGGDIVLTVYGIVYNGFDEIEYVPVFVQDGVQSPSGTGKCQIAPPAVYDIVVVLGTETYSAYRVEIYGRMVDPGDGVLWGDFSLVVQ